jgi:CubicO group peptidase (beta-lactamase class C family)
MKIKLILLLTFVFAINANAQEIDFGKFDSYVKKSMRDFNMPGLAIGVIQNGDIVFQQGYGVRNLNVLVRTPCLVLLLYLKRLRLLL